MRAWSRWRTFSCLTFWSLYLAMLVFALDDLLLQFFEPFEELLVGDLLAPHDQVIPPGDHLLQFGAEFLLLGIGLLASAAAGTTHQPLFS